MAQWLPKPHSITRVAAPTRYAFAPYKAVSCAQGLLEQNLSYLKSEKARNLVLLPSIGSSALSRRSVLLIPALLVMSESSKIVSMRSLH